MPTAFTSAEPAGLIGTPSGEKFTGVVSGGASAGEATAGGGEASSGASATAAIAAGPEGSGAAAEGCSSHQASALAPKSDAKLTPQRRRCCCEASNQVLLTVQVTVWVERGHEVA